MADLRQAAEQAATLHQQIMRLPAQWASYENFKTDDWKAGYGAGHQDARHAAAELVLASSPIEAAQTDDEFLSALDSRGIACDPIVALEIRDLALASAPPAAATAEVPKQWRCFHCDEVFTTEDAAREHFGPRIYSDPACTINAAEYRRMEEAHHRHCEEDTELHRQIHALSGRVDPQEVRRAEEKGYAAGLRDGVNLPADSPERAALSTPTEGGELPAGMALMPRVPTTAMLDAGLSCRDGSAAPEEELANAYRAMVAVAQPTPAAGEWQWEDATDEMLAEFDKPHAYTCPAGCGCLWRDNGNGSMSLFGARSQSCAVCEPMPLSSLVPLYARPTPAAAAGVPPGIRVLNALEVLERMDYKPGDRVLVENFLAIVGRRGMFIIENPLAASGAPAGVALPAEGQQ